MGLEKLNSLASRYFVTRDDLDFNAMYQEARQAFWSQHRARVTMAGLGDLNDAVEMFDSVVLKLSSSDHVDNFGRQMSTSLRNARVDFLRKKSKRNEVFGLSLDANRDESGTTLVRVGTGNRTKLQEVQDGETVEKVFFIKKEDDQRQLVDYLTDPSQVDAEAIIYASAMLDHYYPSIRELAKALDVHPEKVSRQFRKMSRRYDANRFGDIQDYLPEGKRIKKQFLSA